MNGSTTTIRRAKQTELRQFRNFVGMTLLMSMAIVFFGMQLMMVGPLKGRLDTIQTRLNTSESDLRKLVAARESVWKTNDLLSSLEDQALRINDLQNSIADIQTLRNRVQKEGESATIALAAVDRISSLHQRVVGEKELTQNADQSFADMQQLLHQLTEQSSQTEVAANSFDGMLALQNRVIAASNGYEQASESIEGLTELTQRMAAQNDQLKVASARFDEFMRLARAINQSEETLAAAQESTEQLLSLQQQMVAVEGSDTAMNNARTLVAMNDTLNGDSLRLTDARQNLDALLVLEESLSTQSEAVAAAIVNLEIMDDFRKEVAQHISSLDTLRRTLVDIAMMESTIGRVAQMMQPLTEIGNLRRLSETEIREAARVILDRRMTRFSQNSDSTRTDVSSSQEVSAVPAESEDDLVPVPPEARETVTN
ncbi:MAG: hypothetical protein KDA96_05300 [Planctomycetaceae bacterium]|nr:hypothetical protein [Planctomycetaceae bacterium]